MENVVSDAARHQELLADLDDLDELGRVGVEVDHVAGLARGLGAGLHGDADIGLRQRRGVVGAVAAHGDRAGPSACSLADVGELVLGRRLGDEVVDARFRGDGRRGHRIVAGDHDGLDAHAAQLGEALLDVGLDHVLEVDDAEQPAVRRRARAACRPSGRCGRRRRGSPDPATVAPAGIAHEAEHGIDRALAQLRSPMSTPDRRVVAENAMKRDLPGSGPGTVGRTSPAPAPRWSGPPASRRQGWPAAPLRPLRAPMTPGTGMISVAMRLPKVMVPVLSSSSVSTSPAASTARPGHGEHVEPDQPIHAGDADGREQAADGRRDQRDEQRHQHRDRRRRLRSSAPSPDSVTTAIRKTIVMPASRIVERDLVRRLLPLGAFDQRDHAVEEGGARRGRDPHHDPVGEHGGAAGDGRAVAAGLADDGRGLAGDGGLVDRGDAFDDLAVAGDQVAGLDQHDIADVEVERRHRSHGAPLRSGSSSRLATVSRARLAQGVGLRPPAPFGDGLGEVGEQHREPEPGGDLAGEEAQTAPVTRSRTKRTVTRSATTSVTKITGIARRARGDRAC